jgi:hypothetical protein
MNCLPFKREAAPRVSPSVARIGRRHRALQGHLQGAPLTTSGMNTSTGAPQG